MKERSEVTQVPGKRRRLSGPERRAAIVAAAQEVFLDQGFSGARTRVIAERAGITEAVLYRHFASKEEIFDAAVLDPLTARLGELLERSREALAAPGSPAERIAGLQRVWWDHMEAVVPLLGVALFSDQASGRACYRSRVTPVLDALEEEMTAAGIIAGGGASAAAVVRAAFGTMVLLALDRLQTGRERPAGATVDQLTDLYALGLSGGQSLRLPAPARAVRRRPPG